MTLVHPSELTPVERHGGFLVKREDLCGLVGFSGVVGGKLRQAWATAQARPGPLVAWGTRRSNTAAAFAAVGADQGRFVEFHTAAGDPTPEMKLADDFGARIFRHRPGHLSVSRARAASSARTHYCTEAGPDVKAVIEAVARQVESLYPHQPTRVVTAVGSALTLLGIMVGLKRWSPQTTVLGVLCGALPQPSLFAAHAPVDWKDKLKLVRSGLKYEQEVTAALGDVLLDPIYEGKARMYLRDGDLLWNLGCRI